MITVMSEPKTTAEPRSEWPPGANPLPARPKERPADRRPEFGGPKGPEPTRYGDWERNGRVSDFLALFANSVWSRDAGM